MWLNTFLEGKISYEIEKIKVRRKTRKEKKTTKKLLNILLDGNEEYIPNVEELLDIPLVYIRGLDGRWITIKEHSNLFKKCIINYPKKIINYFYMYQEKYGCDFPEWKYNCGCLYKTSDDLKMVFEKLLEKLLEKDKSIEEKILKHKKLLKTAPKEFIEELVKQSQNEKLQFILYDIDLEYLLENGKLKKSVIEKYLKDTHHKSAVYDIKLIGNPNLTKEQIIRLYNRIMYTNKQWTYYRGIDNTEKELKEAIIKRRKDIESIVKEGQDAQEGEDASRQDTHVQDEKENSVPESTELIR